MPTLGAPEVLLVAVIALIVFGPRRLPEIARSLGKSLAEFKRHASDLRSEFEAGLDDPEDEKPAPAPAEGDRPAPEEAGDEKPAPNPAGDERPAPNPAEDEPPA